jgi:tRNA threonylcarbamoyladenosine biosynthesis protein TsaB
VRILGFDTATRATTVALLDTDTGIEREARDDPPPGARPGHATRLLPLAAELLERAGGGWEAIDRLAVGTGPGTFTGLRIGVATARALARARDLPLVGVSTLRSLAMNAAPASGNATVLAVLDARRGEVFAAAWRAAEIENGQATLEAGAFAPQSLAEAAARLVAPVLAIGDGAIEFRQVLERSGASVPEGGSPLHRVSAINHCRLAGVAGATTPDEVLPDYLRVPDAELTRRNR